MLVGEAAVRPRLYPFLLINFGDSIPDSRRVGPGRTRRGPGYGNTVPSDLGGSLSVWF
jgi:hypothetical protein